MPKISIIVPVYKVEKYIRRCLDSIVAQTFIDWECLLIDDGSPDDSGKICDEYADKDSRFRVFHKENGGVSSARNLGLDEAKGEWITFVDSDDALVNESLSIINSQTEQNYDLIHWGDYNRNDNEFFSVIVPALNIFTTPLDFISSRFYRHTVWSYLFRRSIIVDSNIYFPVGLKCSEDQSFLLKYIYSCRVIKCIPCVLYYYYQNSESVTHQGINMAQAFCNCNAALDYLDYAVKLNIHHNQYTRLAIRNFVLDTFYYLSMSSDLNKRESIERYKLFISKYKSIVKDESDKFLLSLSFNYSISIFIIKAKKYVNRAKVFFLKHIK